MDMKKPECVLDYIKNVEQHYVEMFGNESFFSGTPDLLKTRKEVNIRIEVLKDSDLFIKLQKAFQDVRLVSLEEMGESGGFAIADTVTCSKQDSCIFHLFQYR